MNVKIAQGKKEKRIEGHTFEDRMISAVLNGVLTQEEADIIVKFMMHVAEIIAVDDFDSSELQGTHEL